MYMTRASCDGTKAISLGGARTQRNGDLKNLSSYLRAKRPPARPVSNRYGATTTNRKGERMNYFGKIVQIDGDKITIEVVLNDNVKYTTVITQDTDTPEEMVPYAIHQAYTLFKLLRVLDPEKAKIDFTDESVSNLLLQHADYLIDTITFHENYR